MTTVAIPLCPSRRVSDHSAARRVSDHRAARRVTDLPVVLVDVVRYLFCKFSLSWEKRDTERGNEREREREERGYLPGKYNGGVSSNQFPKSQERETPVDGHRPPSPSPGDG